MVSVLLVTHSPLANALSEAARWILGREFEDFHALDLDPAASPQEHLSELERTLSRLDGEQVLILTDLFGGTPHNLALTQLEPGRVEVVSGANLPMMLALDGLRKECSTVAELAPAIAKKGRHAVVDAGGSLKRHRHEFGTGEIPALDP
ncbi:MAG: PTS fructose transporter subunit IIA [Myxococcales bacterium]|nr:PTS fructose transporter subunit IIA [Myxococcales bacterium]